MTAHILTCGVRSQAIAFGLTLNFWLAVAIRFISGSMDFCFGIVKVYIAEGVDEKYRATAMSWTGATWGIAVIVGPSLGGLLARPALQYPDTFAADGVFAAKPYLLPYLAVPTLGNVHITHISHPNPSMHP